MKYVAIGHVCQDVVASGRVLGGTVTYAALTAAALNWDVSVLTRVRTDLDLSSLRGIDWIRLSSAHTTTFENVYTAQGRVQTLHSVADSITSADAEIYRDGIDVVHLAPIANEVDPKLVSAFDGALIGVTPQGWMRQWDTSGRVSPHPWKDAQAILQHADAVISSVADVAGDWSLIEHWASMTHVLVVTQGPQGCTVYVDGKSQHVPVQAIDDVDPTGAGDIFAAAYFVYLRQTQHPIKAARFANCIASQSVLRHGLQGVPTVEEAQRCFEIQETGRVQES